MLSSENEDDSEAVMENIINVEINGARIVVYQHQDTTA